MVSGTNVLQKMHLYGAYVMVHQKVHDARVNAVNPLAPVSSRKLY